VGGPAQRTERWTRKLPDDARTAFCTRALVSATAISMARQIVLTSWNNLSFNQQCWRPVICLAYPLHSFRQFGDKCWILNHSFLYHGHTKDIPRVWLPGLTGSCIAHAKDFTQPHGVTDKDRHWRLIKWSFACPVLNHLKYLLLQKSSQGILNLSVLFIHSLSRCYWFPLGLDGVSCH